MEQDVPALRNMRPGGKEHPIDRVLHDGDHVTLGATTLAAYLTAGHTQGCRGGRPDNRTRSSITPAISRTSMRRRSAFRRC